MTTQEKERERKKLKLIDEYIGATSLSWTWARLTEDERKQFKNWLNSGRYLNTINGTETQRWEIMNNFYFMFLLGLGYGKDKRFEP